jgi:16S rRNA (guanine1516-N2)-methyltransferase
MPLIMPQSVISICGEDVDQECMRQLAQDTGLAIYDSSQSSHPPSPDYLLCLTSQRLELRTTKNTSTGAVYADFISGKSRHRRLQGGGKGQHLAKAIGLHKIKNPTVIDATAGLGRDSFVLATLGCKITMLERSSVIHLLLQDGINRAKASEDSDISHIISGMKLLNGDAINYLENLKSVDYPDVIYLDPMFPERKKSAKVKKEMRFFHDIIGSDEDDSKLLRIALQRAKKRIVVKRPRLANPINNQRGNFIIEGKSTRYDVYLPSH